MIAKLKGLIDSTGDDWVVIDVNGVGYLVHCSSRTLSRIAVGDAVALAVETQVREDAITLYGFLSDGERAFFRLLITVQGVGAKVALAILTIGLPEQLAQAIGAQDKTVFTRAAGVGPKLAGRIVSELKDKVAGLRFTAGGGALGPVAGGVKVSGVAPDPGAEAPAAATDVSAPAAPSAEDGVMEDAVSALVNLGYGRSDAFAAVSRVLSAGEGATSVQKVIGLALKDLGKGL